MNATTAGHTRLVIVGATGMIGGYVLRYVLEPPEGMKMATLVAPDHSGFSRETERSPSPPITSPR
jgi:hypothetical protein